MAKLIYVANVSLDGCIEDVRGSLEWAEPSDEVFNFIAELIRPVSTYLYGRRMYEAMSLWETDPTLAARSPSSASFADLWRDARKIVYSTTLHDVSTTHTELEYRFDAESIRRLKASARGDLTIGGSMIAAHAFDAGVIDECHLLVYPVVVGKGKPAFLSDERVRMELLDQRVFTNGVIYLRYLVSSHFGR